MLAFEFWKTDLLSFSYAAEKIVECILKIANAVLKSGGIHFAEPDGFFAFLHFRELVGLIRI